MNRKVQISAIAIILIIISTFTACSSATAKTAEQLKLGNKYLQEGKYEEAT